MAFMSILLVLFPFLAVGAVFFTGVFLFLAACLVGIGLSGLILNRLEKKAGLSPIAPLWNIGALMCGAGIFLLPVAFGVYQVIMWCF